MFAVQCCNHCISGTPPPISSSSSSSSSHFEKRHWIISSFGNLNTGQFVHIDFFPAQFCYFLYKHTWLINQMITSIITTPHVMCRTIYKLLRNCIHHKEFKNGLFHIQLLLGDQCSTDGLNSLNIIQNW